MASERFLASHFQTHCLLQQPLAAQQQQQQQQQLQLQVHQLSRYRHNRNINRRVSHRHKQQQRVMTISKEVQGQLFSAETNRLICLPIAPAAGSVSTTSPVGSGNNGTPWTEDEHARFLHGLELFPSGPWRSIANVIGTRTARQTMSHAQKYRQKIKRREQSTATTIEKEQELLQQQLAQQHIDAEFYDNFPQSQPPATSATVSPVATLMTDSLSELHLTSEQIDEILASHFDSDNELELTSDDLAVLNGVMGYQ